MPLWRKWQQVDELYLLTRQFHAAGFALCHPGVSAAQVRDDWMEIHRGVYPVQARGAPVNQPPEMKRVVLEVISALRRLNIAYAIGGSVASSIHGIGRSTIDADLMVEPFPGREEQLVALFGPEYYVSLDAVRQAVQERTSFNIISTYTGVKVDLFVQKDRPFERSALSRRITIQDPMGRDEPTDVVTAEDVILLKLEWFRMGNEVSERQWVDVINVLRIRGTTLDRAYLAKWAAELGVLDLLDEAVNEARGGT